MSEVLKQQDEMLDNLEGMSAELIRASREAKKLRSSLLSISKVVQDDKYEILSRFLSGTGAWKVLNKFKATVQTLGQLMSISERSIYKEAETLQGIAKLEERRAKFAGLAAIAAKAEANDRKAIALLMEKIPEVKGLAQTIGTAKAIKRYSKFIKKANDDVKDTMKKLTGKGPPSIFGKIKEGVQDYRKSILRRTSELDPNYKRFGSEQFRQLNPDFDKRTRRKGAIIEDGKFAKDRGTPAQIFKTLMSDVGEKLNAGYAKLNESYLKGIFLFQNKILPKISETASGISEGFSNFMKSNTKIYDINRAMAKVSRVSYDLFKSVMTKFLPVIIGLVLFFTAFFILYRILKNGEFLDSIITTLKVLIDGLSFAFGLVWEGLSSIVEGFRTGDFFKVLEGVAYILGGLAVAALTVLATVVVGALTLIYSVIKGTIGALLERMSSSFSKALSTIFYIAAGIALLVAFLGGGFIAVMISALIAGIGYLIEKFLPFADGGTVPRTGPALVGEKGPELVKLPAGARVFSNKDSKNMVSGGGTTNNITVQVSGRVGASDQEIKDIARKVSREIGLQMNRTGSTAVRF